MTGRIIGTGSCLPQTAFTNEDMTKLVDTSDEWIRIRTGIHSRRLAKGETTVSMAAEAARKALDDAGVEANELDLIITATCSPDDCMPGTACSVQHCIGACHATAFDLNAACSGFLFALHTAYAYICAGICDTALVIGSETISRLIDWTDRGTCVLFGDGAGAVVVQKSKLGLLGLTQNSDGARGSVLTCKNRPIRNPLNPSGAGDNGYIHMDGQEVFKFAVRKVPESIEQLLRENGCKKEEIKFYILHQANERIIRSIAKRLGEPIEKFPMNLADCGNTSAASIPILLDQINRAGRLQKGEKVILAGFGAGLTWGTSLLIW